MHGTVEFSTGGIYMVPCDATTRTLVLLRLDPAVNNQRKAIRWAADHELSGWVP
jgi:hypothetical protein